MTKNISAIAEQTFSVRGIVGVHPTNKTSLSYRKLLSRRGLHF